jgi:MFS family permease
MLTDNASPEIKSMLITDESSPSVNKGVSERALDATTFFLADVADGLGPFLVIDLTSRRDWSSTDAGTAMAMLLLGTVLTQTFTGAWIDRTHYKRMAIAMAALAVAAASIGVYFAPTKEIVYALQILTGVAVTIFPPAIAAISLGMVGRLRLPARAGRNEACFHAGNVTAAGIAICASWLWGTIGIFYGVAAMAIASAVASQFIRERDIDHQLARGADSEEGISTVVPMQTILCDQRILWFAATVVLFHFANAAMLPLVGQKVGHNSPETASTLMAMCIISAQITMVPVAILASRGAIRSRRKVFLIGFALLPVRGLMYTLTDSPTLLIANQILDGICAGIFGVVALLVMADLTRGTGRFNFAQGIVATTIGLGAAASNFLTGMIVDAYGYNSGFLFLSMIAVLALILFAWKVPETVDIHASY